MVKELETEVVLKKLDLGCGPNKKEGYEGIDSIAFPGVDHVFNLGSDPWPFENDSVEDAHCSHCLEHLTPKERCHFFNELGRVLVKGGKCYIVTPNWKSCRAYGDPTHQWPPVSEFFYPYLQKEWRDGNAPHTDAEHCDWGYSCDFDHTLAYSVVGDVAMRSQDYQMFAVRHYCEAADDIAATVVKR